MSTVALEIWTGAYPAIANDITIKVYRQDDDLAVVDEDTHVAPHPLDTWLFPGLDRTNYVFRIFETIAGVVQQQLGEDMNVIPAGTGNVTFRVTEQIEADVTVGVVSGVNTFTLDGTGGSEDWRGWDFDTIDRIGQGPMKRNVDYSWNPATAVFTLLGAGDLIGPNEWFNVQFADQITEGSDSVPNTVPRFSTPKIITANYNINAGSDFGGLLIIRPAGNYLELTLPDIATVVAGKMLDVEMDWAAAANCAKLKTQAGQTIAWLQGARPDLYACRNENFSIFKFIDPAGPTSMWRVWKPFGNFLTVGNSIWSDAEEGDVFNQILFDGASLDIFQYARLYNDHVLQLDPTKTCNFDDWATGNNKKKFSLANGSGADANKFHVPDRRGMTDKNSDGIVLNGAFEAAQVGAFSFNLVIPKISTSKTDAGVGRIVMGSDGNEPSDSNPIPLTINAGKKNLVDSVYSSKYLLV